MAQQSVHSMDQIDPHGFGSYLSPAGLVAYAGALFGAVPFILGVIGGTFAIAWYAVCLWESKTVQGYVTTRRARVLATRIAELEMRQSAIVGELKQLGVLIHADTTVSHSDNGEPVKTQTSIETTTLQIKK